MKEEFRFKLKGKVKVRKLDANGRVLEEDEFSNLVVNVGKAEVAKLIGSGLGGTAFDTIAIGTGTTAESATDTGMEMEVKRKTATVTSVTTTVTDDTAQFVATFSSADGLSGTSAVTEYGLFNSSATPVMLSHAIKSAKNMDWDAGEQLEVTWTVQVQ